MLSKAEEIARLAAWAQPSPARILVIDDNPSIHRDFDLVLRDELQDADLEQQERVLYEGETGPSIPKPKYEVEHAFSGLEGVEKIQRALADARPYQLAFVDIRMPGIDGVETIGRLWKIDGRVQVVICTAFADYSWDDLAHQLGPADNLLVLKKPFDSIEVTQLASTLVRKWFLERQAAMKMEEMELLVARRTEQLLRLQQPSPAAGDGFGGAPLGVTRERPSALVGTAASTAVPDADEESSEDGLQDAARAEAIEDAAFLRRAFDAIEKHLSDYQFDVDQLARALAVSRRQLFRKLKTVTGDTPHTLIRTMRLKRAAQLLRHSQMTVTEITYAVGFSDLKHFRELFREQFGMLPGEYAGKSETKE